MVDDYPFCVAGSYELAFKGTYDICRKIGITNNAYIWVEEVPLIEQSHQIE